MGSKRVSCSFMSRLLSLFSFASLFFLCASEQAPHRDVSLEEPVIQFIPQPFAGFSCERIHISPLSRLKLGHYANSVRVSVNLSESMPERLHWKIELCLHWNNSKGLCECEADRWQSLHKGQWNKVISPFENRYLDVKVNGQLSSSFSLSIQEEFQQYRLFFLGIGFILLLLAPIVSEWAPFYYSSSMALGILLVVLLLLFQGMKLLPMGRKNIFYLTIYGSVLGIGSYIARYFSTLVSTILANFGLGEEMHNPVSVFLLVGIIIAGAGLGQWVVRKYILSKDGSVDTGVAQFVRWAIRIFALIFIFQSSGDTLLALGAIGACWSISYFITRNIMLSPNLMKGVPSKQGLWKSNPNNKQKQQVSPYRRQPEFLSSGKFAGNKSNGTIFPSNNRGNNNNINNNQYGWSNLPKKGKVKPAGKNQDKDYYSSYHKIPRKKYTKRAWDEFTQESTDKALAQWAASPEFARWATDNAHRVHVDRADDDVSPNSDGDDDASVDDSSDESEDLGITNGLGLLRWR